MVEGENMVVMNSRHPHLRKQNISVKEQAILID